MTIENLKELIEADLMNLETLEKETREAKNDIIRRMNNNKMKLQALTT